MVNFENWNPWLDVTVLWHIFYIKITMLKITNQYSDARILFDNQSQDPTVVSIITILSNILDFLSG
jgi:hypothetical protein